MADMNGTVPTLGEMGLLRQLDPGPSGSMPLNGGEWTLPHYQTFVAFMNTTARTYWWTFDEALRDSLCNSYAMRNDLVIREALSARYRSVVTCERMWKPKNHTDQIQVAAAKKVQGIIDEIPYVQQLLRCWMEATFFGKYGVQLLCKWDKNPNVRRMVVYDWFPVHGDKIVYKWDGTPGVLINPSYTQKSWEYTELGPAHFYTPEEQQGFIVHHFEPEDSSYYQPEFAGSVKGSGYRGRLYWWWWLRNNAQKFVMNFLKKAGNGFLLVAYNMSNPAAKAASQRAIEGHDGNNVIYVPVNIKEGEKLDNVIQPVQMQMNGAQLMWTIITGINQLIRMSILGESLTTEAQDTGLGSNLGEQHGMTGDERKKYDATDLETPMQQLTNMLYLYNCPTIPPAKFSFLIDKRNPKETMEAVGMAMQVGLPVPQGWFQDELGIPSPEKNEPVLAQIQPMQATAVENTPAGTPMAGQAGGGQPPQAGQPLPPPPGPSGPPQ